MNEENSKSAPKQDVILDTNILQYITNKKIASELLPYLADLLDRRFGLAISDVSYYELLAGTTADQEKEGLELLSKFTRYAVDVRVLVAASQLSTIYYHQCKLEGRTSHEISFQDKVIAATAALTGSLIITANVNDFPRPFFQEAEEKQFLYKDKNKIRMLVVQLLKPNQEVIQRRFLERPIKS